MACTEDNEGNLKSSSNNKQKKSKNRKRKNQLKKRHTKNTKKDLSDSQKVIKDASLNVSKKNEKEEQAESVLIHDSHVNKENNVLLHPLDEKEEAKKFIIDTVKDVLDENIIKISDLSVTCKNKLSDTYTIFNSQETSNSLLKIADVLRKNSALNRYVYDDRINDRSRFTNDEQKSFHIIPRCSLEIFASTWAREGIFVDKNQREIPNLYMFGALVRKGENKRRYGKISYGFLPNLPNNVFHICFEDLGGVRELLQYVQSKQAQKCILDQEYPALTDVYN